VINISINRNTCLDIFSSADPDLLPPIFKINAIIKNLQSTNVSFAESVPQTTIRWTCYEATDRESGHESPVAWGVPAAWNAKSYKEQ
jgi:hypothetical protein